MDAQRTVRIGVVGPCAAGKSTLVAGLEKCGYSPRHIAQEHSYVPDMWQKITNPDILIFLDVAYPTTLKRRQMHWEETEFLEQQRRLAHARQHANLYLDTEQLTIEEVLIKVLRFLENNINPT
jgi:cytidylate kinase